MRKRTQNEMAFIFTDKGLMVSFLSPLPIKWDKNTQRIPQIFILTVRKDGAAEASSSH